ncbi:MAG TPA: AMP-binding protein [Syntrophales bacterium]|nr:AMP-binding protein [Syntrophales bacterium]HOL59356.1 AMP-binding protein [Syntrophales bacterium]HPO35452.1 AMP-binding protein [Syntrophales bacterium]
MNNLRDMLKETVSLHRDRPFITHDRRSYTYGEFYQAALSLAEWFTSEGLKKGDKIAIMLPNCPEFPLSYFAAQMAGAVAVTLNVQSTSYELHYLLENSEAKVLITQEGMAKRFLEIRDELPNCRFLLTTGDIEEITKKAPEYLPLPPIGRDDAAAMVYTAGLTGRPLGAVLTHGNLLSQSVLLKLLFDADESFRNLAVIPFFHTFGCAANLLVVMRVGGSTVLLERFSLEAVFQTLERERVTYFCGVPRLFLGMLWQEGAEKYDLSALKFCMTGGAPMPAEYIPAFKERFGIPLLEGYGLTEASPICAVTSLKGKQKPGSIGPVIPGAEARIVDERGNTLPAGEVGELVFRGENVMQGYYKAPEATRQVIRDGWLHTGDLGYMDEDGYIFLTGRKKRMIITSGFNVYPKEVETAILLHPAVEACVVSGKADLLRGEVVKAKVLLKAGKMASEKEIFQHCRLYLSPYKVPREIEFVSSPAELERPEAI